MLSFFSCIRPSSLGTTALLLATPTHPFCSLICVATGKLHIPFSLRIRPAVRIHRRSLLGIYLVVLLVFFGSLRIFWQFPSPNRPQSQTIWPFLCRHEQTNISYCVALCQSRFQRPSFRLSSFTRAIVCPRLRQHRPSQGFVRRQKWRLSKRQPCGPLVLLVNSSSEPFLTRRTLGPSFFDRHQPHTLPCSLQLREFRVLPTPDCLRGGTILYSVKTICT